VNVNIPDDLVAQLYDEYNSANLSSGCDGDDIGAYLGLLGVVEALFVYIPKPEPKIVFVPVTEVVPPAPKPRRGLLTKHQREVYEDILKLSRRLASDGFMFRWVDGGHVGSRGACDKLVEKGYIEVQIQRGPRGGEYPLYRPIVDSSTTSSTAVDNGSSS
jgi:hypothetical protein